MEQSKMGLPNPVRDVMDRPKWLVYMEEKLRPERRRKKKKRTARMEQIIDKNDPLMAMLKEYKRANKMKTLGSFEDLVETIEGTPAVASVKVDGEIALLGFERDDARLVSLEGRVRRKLPLTDEAIRKLRGMGPSVFVMELYGVDEQGNELPYPKAISLLRKPEDESDEKRIRAAVFDVLEYDGTDVSKQDYWKRLTIATNVFGGGTYVNPVYATENGESTVERLWDQQVLKEGHEGLVIRVDDTYKIKPVNTLDLAVTGIEISGTHPEWAGALLLSFMDEEGVFRDAGKVGTGLTQKDREEWLQWAKQYKVSEEDRHIWVDPFEGDRVIEVRHEGINVKERPALRYSAGRYRPVGQKASTTLRKPVVVRLREDKHVAPDDVRVSQVPQIREGFIIHWAQEEEEEAEGVPGGPPAGYAWEAAPGEEPRLVPTVEPGVERVEIPWEQLFERLVNDVATTVHDDRRAFVHVPTDSPLLEHPEELANISLGPAADVGGYPGALFIVHSDQTMESHYEGEPYSITDVTLEQFLSAMQNYRGELVVEYQEAPAPEEAPEPIDIKVDTTQYASEWTDLDEYITAIEEEDNARYQETEVWEPRFPIIVRISPNSALGMTEAHNVLQYGSTGPLGLLNETWGTDAIFTFIDDTLSEGWEVDYRPEDQSVEDWTAYVRSFADAHARGTPAAEQKLWLERLRPERPEAPPEEEVTLTDRAEGLLGPPPEVDVDIPAGMKREDLPEEFFVAHWAFIDAYNETQPAPYRLDRVNAQDVLRLYSTNEDLRDHMDVALEELGVGAGLNTLERILAPSLEEEIPPEEEPEEYIKERLSDKLDLLLLDLNKIRENAGSVRVLLNPNFMKIPEYASAISLAKDYVEDSKEGVSIDYKDSTDINMYEGYRIEAVDDWQMSPEEFEEYTLGEPPLTREFATIYDNLEREIESLAEEASAVEVYLDPDVGEHVRLFAKLDAETEPDIRFNIDETGTVDPAVGYRIVSVVPKEIPAEEVPLEQLPEEVALSYEQVATEHPSYIDRYREVYFGLFMAGEVEEAKFEENDIADAFNLGVGTEADEVQAKDSLAEHIKSILQARAEAAAVAAEKFPYEDLLRLLETDVDNRRPVIVYVSEHDYPEVAAGGPEGQYADRFEALEHLDMVGLTTNPALEQGDWSFNIVDLVEMLPSSWEIERQKAEKYGPIQEKKRRNALERSRISYEEQAKMEQEAFAEVSNMVARLPEEEQGAFANDFQDGMNWFRSIVEFDPETKKSTDIEKLLLPQNANQLKEFLAQKTQELEDLWYDEIQTDYTTAQGEGFRMLAKAYGIDLPRTKYPADAGPGPEAEESMGYASARHFLRERPDRQQFWGDYYYVHRAFSDDYKRGWLDAAYKTGYIPQELTDPTFVGGPEAPPEPVPEEIEREEPAEDVTTEQEVLEMFRQMESALQELVATYPIAEETEQLTVRVHPTFLDDRASADFLFGRKPELRDAIGYNIVFVRDDAVPREPGFSIKEPPKVPEEVPEEDIVVTIPETGQTLYTSSYEEIRSRLEAGEPLSPRMQDIVDTFPEQFADLVEPPLEVPTVPAPPPRKPLPAEKWEIDGRTLGEGLHKEYMEARDKEKASENLWSIWHSAATFANGPLGEEGVNLYYISYLKGIESAFAQADPRWQKFFDDARAGKGYEKLNAYWTKVKPEPPKPVRRPTRRPETPLARGEEAGKALFESYFTDPRGVSSIRVDNMFRRYLHKVPLTERDEWAQGVIAVVDPDEELGWADGFRKIVDEVNRKEKLEEVQTRVPRDMGEAGRFYAEEVMARDLGAVQLLDALSDPKKFMNRPAEFKEGFWDYLSEVDDKLAEFLYENLPQEREIPKTDEEEGRMMAEDLLKKFEGKATIRPELLSAYKEFRQRYGDEWMTGFYQRLPEEIKSYVEEEYEKHPEWTYKGPERIKPYMQKPKGKGWTATDFADFARDVNDYAVQVGWSPAEVAKFIERNTVDWTPSATLSLYEGLPPEVRRLLSDPTELYTREWTQRIKKRFLGGSRREAQEYLVPYMRGDELAHHYFGRGPESPTEPVFPYEVGDAGTLKDIDQPIVTSYLDELAREQFGIEHFTDVVSERDRKTIRFVFSKTLPHSIWENDDTLLVNLYRVDNEADFMSLLIHEFRHVMSALAGEPMSERRERGDATPEEYTEFPEEEVAYQEMIKFMSYILRMPRAAIREKLLSVVGPRNEDKVDEWLYIALGVRLPETEGELLEELAKVTADYPKHPDTVVVRSEFYPKGLTEADVWGYYDREKERIVAELKGHDAMLVIQADGEIYKRHPDSEEEFIKIDSAVDFDRYNNGRTIEFHKVVADSTDYGYVDVDPKEDVAFEKTKEIATDVHDLLAKQPDVSGVDLAYSGGRGFHLYPRYRRAKSTDQAREELKSLMDEYIEQSGDEKLTTGIARENDMIRLDTSTLHRTGSLRVLGSLNARTGLKCLPVARNALPGFRKESAKIEIPARESIRLPATEGEFFEELAAMSIGGSGP